MKRITKKNTALIMTFLLTLSSMAGSRGYQEKDHYEKTIAFSNPKGQKTLEVDNIFGSIRVEGYSGKEVRIAYEQTLHAKIRSELVNARNETELQITENQNHVLLYAEAPYRRQEGERYRKFYYHAQYDIVIQVPQDVQLRLQTVNNGDIEVSDIRGEFLVENVNGSITLKNIDGPCHAHTVNGFILADFATLPSENCSFETINGDLTLGFQEKPHGDYRMKTFNGEMYSDFGFSLIPGQGKLQKARKNGLTKITTDDFTKVRIGAGGPVFELETLNGDILIREN